MAVLSPATVYDALVDVLASNADRESILKFRLNDSDQERLESLLDKNRSGRLTEAESSELETYEHFEHVVRLLKARVLQRQPL